MSHQFRGSQLQQGILRGDRVLLVLIIAVLIFVFIRSREMGLGTITEPGPGLWPSIVSVATIAASVAALALSRTAPEPFSLSGSSRVAIFVVSIAVFIPAYDIVGFIPAGMITIFLLLSLVYRTKLLVSIIVTLTSPPLIYMLFGVALDVPISAFG